jgi:YVTN family beta-propeller protein
MRHIALMLAVLLPMARSSVAAEPPPVRTDLPIAARFTVADQPDWMVSGFDQMWLASYEPGSLHRIDPRQDKITGSVATGGPSCHRIATGLGRVWAVDCKAGVLMGVDPVTLTIDRRFPLPLDPEREGSLAIGAGSVWVTVRAEDGSAAVARVEPVSGAILARIALPAGASGVVFGFGSVWVSSTDAGVVSRIDPKTNRVIATIAAGERPRFMAVGRDAIWVMHLKNNAVSRLDPRTNVQVASIVTGAPLTGGGDIAVGEGGVWLPVSGRPVTRLDERTGEVTHAFSGGRGTGATAVGFGSVWIADYKAGEVWRVNVRALDR